MKKLVLIIVLILAVASICIATVTPVDTAGIGVRVFPQVVADAPAEPFDCLVAQRGKVIYVDDNDDTAEAYLCYCATIIDDTNYEWLKSEDPTTDCFP